VDNGQIVADGQIVEENLMCDLLTFLKQIGLSD
jgi:hypothetical protein